MQSAASHAAFCHSFGIPYTLLADTDKTMSAAYGVLDTGPLGGNSKRVTFIVSPGGKIIHVDSDVDSHLTSCATDWIKWARANK